jgi:hypothetical protein
MRPIGGWGLPSSNLALPLYLVIPPDMDTTKSGSIVSTSGKHDGVSEAAPSDAMTPDEAASPAELAFIAQVRGDRARVRTLLRRAIVSGAALTAAIAVLFLAHGILRWPSGDNVPTPGTAVTPGPAPSGQLSPTRDAAGTTPPLHGRTNNETITAQLEALAQPKAPPDGEALEQRVTRLEARLGALEDRATVVEHRPQRLASAASTATPRSAVHSAKPMASARATGVAATSPRATTAPSPSPSQLAQPRNAPTGKEPHRPQTAAVSPPRDVKANPVVSTKRVAAVSPARQTARRPETAAQGLTIGEKVRRGWETIERHVRRTPDEVRDGVTKVKRLFGG